MIELRDFDANGDTDDVPVQPVEVQVVIIERKFRGAKLRKAREHVMLEKYVTPEDEVPTQRTRTSEVVEEDSTALRHAKGTAQVISEEVGFMEVDEEFEDTQEGHQVVNTRIINPPLCTSPAIPILRLTEIHERLRLLEKECDALGQSIITFTPRRGTSSSEPSETYRPLSSVTSTDDIRSRLRHLQWDHKELERDISKGFCVRKNAHRQPGVEQASPRPVVMKGVSRERESTEKADYQATIKAIRSAIKASHEKAAVSKKAKASVGGM